MKIKIFIQRFAFLVILSFGSVIGYSQFDLVNSPFGGFGFPFIPSEPIQDGVFLYVPNTNTSHSIRAKSDLQFSYNQSTMTSSDWDFKIKNFNLAYSPLPHLYGTANVMTVKDGGLNYFESNMIEGDIGIGGYYFKALPNIFKKENIFNKTAGWMMPQKGILVNGLLGYSFGKTDFNRYELVGYGDFSYSRKYIQLGTHFQSNLWGVSGVIKYGKLNYKKTRLFGLASLEEDELIATLMNRNIYSFLEISLRFFVGVKFGQLNIGMILTDVSPDFHQSFNSGYISVGAVVDIQDIFKEIKK